jgi:hypothetical protein
MQNQNPVQIDLLAALCEGVLRIFSVASFWQAEPVLI